MKTLVVAGLIASLLFPAIAPATSVWAADISTESITLTPVTKHYELDAGTSARDSFKVINSGQSSYDFIVYARPYTIVDSDYERPDYGDKANNVLNADAYRWAEFDQANYHIEPGQEVEVSYSLKVPTGATPGGHYGVLFAEVQSGAGGMIGRNKRVGTVVYATVKGEYKTGAELSQPGASFFQIYPPLTAHTAVKNTGNASFVATTTFKVSDIFGGEKYVTQLEQDVISETTRATELAWKDSPSFGLFKVAVNTKALDKQVSYESYVLMAPFWVFGLVAILVVGGVMYAVARRKR